MLRLFRLLIFLSGVFCAKTALLNKHRRASDVVIDLITRSGIDNDLESQDFRQMIATHQSTNPLKLLHYLAPKIPAIRHSPDVALRIRAAKNDMDCGLAACVVATLGRACELDDDLVDDILKDRRFEQLIECVMCGVDHKEEYTGGLSIRDACRAAWGLPSSDNNLESVLEALTFRVAHGDMVHDGIETIQEGLEVFSEELAEDAVTVLWTFACVKACTGQNVTSLVNLCASLLVQDPFATRKMAQEASLSSTDDDVNLEIGANDVVERLAQSEMEADGADNATQTDHAVIEAEDSFVSVSEAPTMSEKSHVMDWLSPNELIDSLWAIALLGAKLEGASCEIDEYCEKVLQKMAEIVHRELRRLKLQYETEDDINDVDQEVRIAVEVTKNLDDQILGDDDADEYSECVLWEISNGSESQNIDVDTESTQLGGDLNDHESIPLKVADAFELINTERLRDEACEAIVGDSDEGTSETFVSVLDIDDAQEPSNESRDEKVARLPESSLPRDLSSLAWAVTELDGSHREVILHDISSMFKILGVDSVRGLLGPDLSNVCWSIAKSNFAIQDEVSDSVVKWIADRVMEIASEDDGSNDSSSLLRHLSPHELSRLVWSLATILLDQGTVRWTSVSIVALTYRALITAGSHLDVFSSEDMVSSGERHNVFSVVETHNRAKKGEGDLGFSEFDRHKSLFGWPDVPHTLGKLLASIETSLLEWENVRESISLDAEIHDNRETSKVASLLGRSRFALRFFDQQIEVALDDDSEDTTGHTKKANRQPLLRNVPVDPLSLCKLSSAICKLAHQFDKSLIQNGVLVRIPLRLFTSHDGRLLRECPLPDLARLAEAAALSTDVASARVLTGHFTRKVLHIINEMPSDELGFIWLDLGPADLSGMIWSLGHLGVRFCGTEFDRSTAHRRLHLAVKPYFPLQSLEAFSVSKTIRMLNGLVSTQLALRMMDHVAQILLHLEHKLSMTEEELDLCVLLTTPAALRRNIVEENSFSQDELEDKSGNFTKSSNVLYSDDPEKSASLSPGNLLGLCDQVLASLTIASAERLSRTSTSDLLQILSVLVRERLQCDELVGAIDACVQERAVTFNAKRRAVDTVSAASGALSSLLHASGNESDVSLSVREMSPLLDIESLRSTVASLDGLHRALSSVSRVSRKTCLNAMELEISWVRELVEQYNRMDFKCGSLRSGLDQKRRRRMAKRALSRLLPVPSQTLP